MTATEFADWAKSQGETCKAQLQLLIEGGGGRNSQTQFAAIKLVLEAAKLIGESIEQPKKRDNVLPFLTKEEAMAELVRRRREQQQA